MIKTEYRINKRDFLSKRNTVLKEKLKNLTKARTIRNLEIDDLTNSYVFNITQERGGIKMEIPFKFSGKYEIMDISGDTRMIQLKLYVTSK